MTSKKLKIPEKGLFGLPSKNPRTEDHNEDPNEDPTNLETDESENLRIEEPKNLETKEPISPGPRNLENKKRKNEPNSKGFINQGYMMDEELIGVLSLYTALTKQDKSEIIRNALRAYIPQDYFDLWRKN